MYSIRVDSIDLGLYKIFTSVRIRNILLGRTLTVVYAVSQKCSQLATVLDVAHDARAAENPPPAPSLSLSLSLPALKDIRLR